MALSFSGIYSQYIGMHDMQWFKPSREEARRTCPDRIVPIAERFGMDPGAVLDKIIYARAHTYEHQYNLLLGLAATMSEEPFKLLVMDSVIALFQVEFTRRGELAERQQKLAQMLSRLLKIAEEFNVAVYMDCSCCMHYTK
ncbi:meiotic recombination protein DMC1 homolog [Eucalyptus grandis]|uniref:meiotic recombination protein DMC1 homolog n=1 Tax=Eucalyptus grandis TaxID=71139 RepID=UPI00192ED6EE|nr:meiotic recombination protein DMC1 homolog [Eucalyptus grandis]